VRERTAGFQLEGGGVNYERNGLVASVPFAISLVVHGNAVLSHVGVCDELAFGIAHQG
jgi:hypothetical protein